MKITWICMLALVAVSGVTPAGAQPADSEQQILRPVHTYSIVARDSVTGEMGVLF